MSLTHIPRLSSFIKLVQPVIYVHAVVMYIACINRAATSLVFYEWRKAR